MAQSPRKDFVRMTHAERRKQALELRTIRCLTYDEIAEQLGYSDRGHAKKDIDKAIAEITLEAAEDCLKAMLARHAKLYSIAFVKAAEGNLAAIDRCIAIDERVARLYRLDKQEVTITGPNGGPLGLLDPGIEIARKLAGLLSPQGGDPLVVQSGGVESLSLGVGDMGEAEATSAAGELAHVADLGGPGVRQE
jgi:hypothetical protein